MSPEFLRSKKGLKPLASHRTMLHGFNLSFPLGKGIDFVEPSFAALRRNPDGLVHGVCTLFSAEDAKNLDEQEGVGGGKTYAIEVHRVALYDSGEQLEAEIYAPTRELPAEHPEGCCSVRYRDILVKGALEMELADSWVQKLRDLPVYSPSEETLAARARLPPPSALPAMTIAELAEHNGASEDKPVYSSSCGYIFAHREVFRVMWGRDVTYRNILQRRGQSLDSNDDGGRSPFPRLSALEPEALEYALQYRDRFAAKGGAPVAALKEFWEEQEEELPGVFHGNTLSRLGSRGDAGSSGGGCCSG